MFVPLLIACANWVPDVTKIIRSKVLKYVAGGILVLMMMAFEYSTYQVDYQRYDDEGGTAYQATAMTTGTNRNL